MCESLRVAGFNTRCRGGPAVFNTELHAECERLLHLRGCAFGELVVDSHVEGVLLGLCGRDALPVAASVWGFLDQNALDFIIETCVVQAETFQLLSIVVHVFSFNLQVISLQTVSFVEVCLVALRNLDR